MLVTIFTPFPTMQVQKASDTAIKSGLSDKRLKVSKFAVQTKFDVKRVCKRKLYRIRYNPTYTRTRGPRWPWIAHMIFFLDYPSQFFFFVAFREQFTRIPSCLYSARSPHSLIPCSLTDQNFTNNYGKGNSRNVSMRLFRNLTSSFRDFLGISVYSYIEVVAIHQSQIHGWIKISLNFYSH